MIDWSKYPNFKESEFNCSKTGKNYMQSEFMDKLQALRTEYGRPMTITSGYRDITHPQECDKPVPGYHNKGLACDIGCGSDVAYQIAALAFKHGFTGIGVSQNGKNGRFIHLDLRMTAPVLYSY